MFAKFWTLMTFLASSYAFLNPALNNRISVMKVASGTTIEIDLNRFLRSIGSSVLPA